MSERPWEIIIADILESIENIEEYTHGMTKEEFLSQKIVKDAVVRNLEIIGEAAKNIPESFRKKHSTIEWKEIVGLRNIIIHKYFGVDYQVIWSIVEKELPTLKKKLLQITGKAG